MLLYWDGDLNLNPRPGDILQGDIVGDRRGEISKQYEHTMTEIQNFKITKSLITMLKSVEREKQSCTTHSLQDVVKGSFHLFFFLVQKYNSHTKWIGVKKTIIFPNETIAFFFISILKMLLITYLDYVELISEKNSEKGWKHIERYLTKKKHKNP